MEETKEELIHFLKLAYYRAKCDIFYSNSNYDFSLVLAYEQNLDENLTELANHIQLYKKDKNVTWFATPDFLGDWYVVGKSREKGKNGRVVNNFRFMTRPSMHFQVLASYWIALVGQKLDASFPDNIYANRLNKKPFNQSMGGNYKRYQYQYGSWQRNAIQTISDALEKNLEVESVCLDVEQFYYTIHLSLFPFVMLDFQDMSNEEKINFLFFKILYAWSKRFSENKESGIPVGLVASPILANYALLKFDSLVCSIFHPLFYGRYCDDIICIFASHEKEYTLDDFFNKICPSSVLHVEQNEDDKFRWNGFKFNRAKCSCHFYSGGKGKAEAIVFQRQMGERTSEWRALPDIPSPEEIPSKMLSFFDVNNEEAKALRDLHSPSVMRQQFSFLLRDCETFAHIFRPDEWKTIRKTFLKTFGEFCMDMEHWFTFEKYFHRVLALGILCKDYQEVADLFVHLSDCVSSLFDPEAIISCEIDTRERDEIEIQYCGFLVQTIVTTFLQVPSSFSLEKLWKAIPFEKQESKFLESVRKEIDNPENDIAAMDYFCHDLGYFPLRVLLFGQEQNPLLLYPSGKKWYKELRKRLPEQFQSVSLSDASLCRALRDLNEKKPGTMGDDGTASLFPCFAYLTRVFSDLDFVYELDGSEAGEEYWKACQELLLSFRGYGYRDTNTGHHLLSKKDSYDLYIVPNGDAIKTGKGVSIAVACMRMDDKKLEDILLKKQENRLSDYQRFTKLINSVLSCRNPIDYLVFPELAIPKNWFLGAVKNLQRKRINFISGIEYQFTGRKRISNCVYAGLRHTMNTYPATIVLYQKKQIPAYQEADDVSRTMGYSWDPKEKDRNPDRWPPVVQHGNFFFSLLICSDLMNIQYRSNLRGNIDCLFVPEWNKSVSLYNDLVQASANDLHAFIVQCNNNVYGDCRIRAPYKEEYAKDIVKAKGGDNEYFIVGTIKVAELRNYQLYHIPKSPDPLFKPYPIGFEMSRERRRNYVQLEENEKEE